MSTEERRSGKSVPLTLLIIIVVIFIAGVGVAADYFGLQILPTGAHTADSSGISDLLREIAERNNIPTSGGQENYPQIVRNLIALREAWHGGDTILQSKLITQLDKTIQKNNPALDAAWVAIASCTAVSCSQDDFDTYLLDIVNIISVPQALGNNTQATVVVLLIYIKDSWKYNRIFELSAAITHVDSSITEIGNPELIDTWKEIVACKGKCAESNSLTIEAIKELFRGDE